MNIPRMILELEKMNVEFELCELFAIEEQNVFNRTIILDDSYSMEENDGMIFDNKTKRMKYCKRNEEMMSIVTDCCKLYSARIISSGTNIDSNKFYEYRNICDTLEEIDLNSTNFIMIFTDTNPQYSRMLNILSKFKGKILVRLCGNSSENYSYWKSVAFRLSNCKMTIIQNYHREYNICNNINFPLNYKYSLHKCREMGINSQLLLDVSCEELSNIQIDRINFLTVKITRFLCC